MAEGKGLDEFAPILGERNHASEGYETFEQGTPQGVSNGNELQVPAHVSHLRINVGQATAANNDDDDAMIYDDDDVDEIPDIEDDLLRKSLPSTALRRMKSVIKPGTVRQRKFSSRQALSVSGIHETAFASQPGIDGYEIEEIALEDTDRLRDAAVPIHAKRSFNRTLKRQKPKRIGRWKQFKFNLSMKWTHFKAAVVEFFKNIDFWQSNLKAVEGKFGSGVLSYFKFLRWLFLLDVFISLLVLGFLLVPQVLYSPSSESNKQSFTGVELLSGEGWFKNSEMYYGTYANKTIELIPNMHYNIPFAYLCVAGGYILLCLIILVRSMGMSYKTNYVSGQNFQKSFFTKVFCSWDYALTEKNSAAMKSKNIYQDLMESVSESVKKEERSSKDICYLVFLRTVTNLLTFAMMAGACYLIYYVSNEAVKSISANSLTKGILPAVTISTLNFLLPIAFRIIATLEQYSSPRHLLAVSLFRTILLKLSTLCVYVTFLYSEVNCLTNASNTNCDTVTCWETWVGEQAYKLAVIDFIYLVLATLLGEYVRRFIISCSPYLDERYGYPGFDISRNVLDLIYAQGVCWIGAFFCPMLPPISVIKLFILFYLKRDSALRNCRPTMRPFKASKMNLLFLLLLGLMLALACIVIGYVIMNDDRMKPSATCGPFRGKSSIYQLVKDVINNDLPSGLRQVINVAASATVIGVIFFILVFIAYYYRLRKKSAEKKIKLLKDQVALAGQDKLFLLTEIRSILKLRAVGNRSTTEAI